MGGKWHGTAHGTSVRPVPPSFLRVVLRFSFLFTVHLLLSSLEEIMFFNQKCVSQFRHNGSMGGAGKGRWLVGALFW